MSTNGFKVETENEWFIVISSCFQCCGQNLKFGDFKAWPIARNISTQHLATLSDTTCCVRLAILLRYVACIWPVQHHVRHHATMLQDVAQAAQAQKVTPALQNL